METLYCYQKKDESKDPLPDRDSETETTFPAAGSILSIVGGGVVEDSVAVVRTPRYPSVPEGANAKPAIAIFVPGISVGMAGSATKTSLNI